MTELGLPEEIKACLFDLDGVVTRTAVVHAAAWKEMFDAFLREREGEHFRPFDDHDYDEYVDGLPRADGVRTFLASRGIELPDGKPDDPRARRRSTASATARTRSCWRRSARTASRPTTTP